jgi:hypothetical protein
MGAAYYVITLLPYYVLEVQAMRLHGVACAMRDFKRSLRPDAHMAKLWLVARHRMPGRKLLPLPSPK